MAQKPILFLVGTSPKDHALEAEFNRWYDQVHIPEIMRLGFMTKASRYQLEEDKEGYPQFLAVYEFPDEQALSSFNEHGRKQRGGQATPFTTGPQATVIWRAVYKPL